MTGANVELRCSRRGFSCLHAIMSRGDDALTDMLLRQGADPNARTVAGNIPLILFFVGDENLGLKKVFPYQRVKKPCDIIRQMVQHGADLNLQSSDGVTALHAAVAFGAPVDIIRTLLELGADPSIRTADGETALALAERMQNSAVAMALRKHKRHLKSSSASSTTLPVNAEAEAEARKHAAALEAELELEQLQCTMEKGPSRQGRKKDRKKKGGTEERASVQREGSEAEPQTGGKSASAKKRDRRNANKKNKAAAAELADADAESAMIGCAASGSLDQQWGSLADSSSTNVSARRGRPRSVGEADVSNVSVPSSPPVTPATAAISELEMLRR